MKLILKSAKWSTDSTFNKFYVKDTLQAHMHENDSFEIDLHMEHYNVIG